MILITGAGGYLGRRVLTRLWEQGVFAGGTSRRGAVGWECDLTDALVTRRLLATTNPSAIIHCAAHLPERGRPAAESVAMLQNLADAECPIVFASSMAVYADTGLDTVSEDDAVMPADEYPRGKWLAERVLLERGVFGDVALRLPSLFGRPRPAGILYSTARGFLSDHWPALHPNNRPWSALANDDAADYLIRAALEPRDVKIMNVGYPGSFDLASAVRLVGRLCCFDWYHPPTRRFEMKLDRLEATYGLPDVTFEQRVAELVDWVRVDIGHNPSLPLANAK